MIRANNQQKGFTLVELVVVIVILGIISAVAAPRFFDQQAYKERVFKDDLVSALRYAQKRAVASGEKVKVTIDSSGFRLNYASGVAVPHPAGGDFVQQDSPPSSINTGTIGFDALGRVDSGATSYTDITADGSYDNVGLNNISIAGETGCVTQ